MMNSTTETPSWSSITEYPQHMRSIHHATNRGIHTCTLTNMINPCESESWFSHHRRQLNGEWKDLGRTHYKMCSLIKSIRDLHGAMIYGESRASNKVFFNHLLYIGIIYYILKFSYKNQKLETDFAMILQC